MWKVVVLACNLFNPEQCMKFDDAWGPYATKQECVERGEVLSKDILKILPPSRLWWRCEPEREMT